LFGRSNYRIPRLPPRARRPAPRPEILVYEIRSSSPPISISSGSSDAAPERWMEACKFFISLPKLNVSNIDPATHV
jgi:hypothetical protein